MSIAWSWYSYAKVIGLRSQMSELNKLRKLDSGLLGIMSASSDKIPETFPLQFVIFVALNLGVKAISIRINGGQLKF